MKRLRCYLMLLLVMASVLMGVCQAPKTGFSAHATTLNFYFNDDPSSYPDTGQTRVVAATVQISIVADGTFIPGVHTHPSWTISISGPDPNNPQQTTTVASATFTHPGPYTNANVSITLPAAAGTYTYTASLTGGTGTATPASDSATIVKVESLVPSEGIEVDDGDGNADTQSYIVPIAASGTVTVTATPYVSVAENQLPSGWSFTGGTAVGLGKFQRTVSKTTAGTTTFTCTCGSSNKTVQIYVVEVSSLTPSEGTEFDDGDNDPNTRSFVVKVADEGDVIVTATPSPSIPTELMPLEVWSFTGGDLVTNDNKYERSTSKSTVGKTTFVASCGNSEKTTVIYCQENDTEVNVEISKNEIMSGAKQDEYHQAILTISVIPPSQTIYCEIELIDNTAAVNTAAALDGEVASVDPLDGIKRVKVTRDPSSDGTIQVVITSSSTGIENNEGLTILVTPVSEDPNISFDTQSISCAVVLPENIFTKSAD